MHVCVSRVLKSLVCYTLCSDVFSCSEGVHFQHADSVCVCVCLCIQARSLLWGSTWEREGVPRHWAFHRKIFHRLSKNPNDFSRH